MERLGIEHYRTIELILPFENCFVGKIWFQLGDRPRGAGCRDGPLARLWELRFPRESFVLRSLMHFHDAFDGSFSRLPRISWTPWRNVVGLRNDAEKHGQNAPFHGRNRHGCGAGTGNKRHLGWTQKLARCHSCFR